LATLRLLALLTDGFGASGGIAQYNRDLLAALSESSYIEEVIVLPRFGTYPVVTPRKIVQAPPTAGRTAWCRRAVVLALRQRPDVILCGHLRPVPFAAGLAQVLRRPLWLQVHGIEAWERPNKFIRLATEQAKLVTSVSRYTRQRLTAWSNITPERVRVLPNTIGEIHAPRTPRRDLVHKHKLQGKKVILTVGRLSSLERYKGHDRIIAAMPHIALRCPEVVYLIVGDGDDRPRFEALARDHGVEGRIILAGNVPPEVLPDYYALADVFAMPSTGEGFGIVFLEAAISGLPVIAGNVDGSVDAVADGIIGKMINPDDIEAIALAIVDALKGRLPANPAAARRFAFENFARHVDQLVQTLGR
jgi:phosphatidylinositol alpha-1,6-mannosyltransferase